MDEPALIHEAQRGDLDAFNRLVMAHQARVYNLALRIMDDPASAADAAQEAFLAAYKHLGSYRGGSFRAWLLRIVTNTCYDEIRRRRRRPTTPLDDLDTDSEGPEPEASAFLAASEDGPEAMAERAEVARAIQDCLRRLPAEFRIVAVLADVEGLDYQEVSAIISKPLGTVKSRLARARARLRDCLGRHRELSPAAFRLEGEATP
jgi:RNA polymerase sigma-70 factor (ECF subfamily)